MNSERILPTYVSEIEVLFLLEFRFLDTFSFQGVFIIQTYIYDSRFPFW